MLRLQTDFSRDNFPRKRDSQVHVWTYVSRNCSEGVKDSTVHGLLFHSFIWYTSQNNGLLVNTVKRYCALRRRVCWLNWSLFYLFLLLKGNDCIYCWILNKCKRSLLLLHTLVLYLESSEISFVRDFKIRVHELLLTPKRAMRRSCPSHPKRSCAWSCFNVSEPI